MVTQRLKSNFYKRTSCRSAWPWPTPTTTRPPSRSGTTPRPSTRAPSPAPSSSHSSPRTPTRSHSQSRSSSSCRGTRSGSSRYSLPRLQWYRLQWHPAYNVTGYSDTLLTVVTALTCPKWPVICQKQRWQRLQFNRIWRLQIFNQLHNLNCSLL